MLSGNAKLEFTFLLVYILGNISNRKSASETGALAKLGGRSASLRISLYTDDVILFVKPIKKEVETIVRLQTLFGEATGLVINF